MEGNGGLDLVDEQVQESASAVRGEEQQKKEDWLLEALILSSNIQDIISGLLDMGDMDDFHDTDDLFRPQRCR